MTTIYHQRYRKLIDHYKNIVCEGYTERHHIIPKCMGGDNSEDNLVDLPAKTHYIAHLLLTKMYPENSLVWAAFGAMSMRTEDRKLTARQFEKLRIASKKAAMKPVTIDEIYFTSRSAAAKHFNVSDNTIRNWENTNNNKSGDGAKGKLKPVAIDGIYFASRSAAAKHFGVSKETIKAWDRNGGYSINREKSTFVRGKQFASRSQAAKYYGVSRRTIGNWMEKET